MTIVRKQSPRTIRPQEPEKVQAAKSLRIAHIKNKTITLSMFLLGFGSGSLIGLITFLIVSNTELKLPNRFLPSSFSTPELQQDSNEPQKIYDTIAKNNTDSNEAPLPTTEQPHQTNDPKNMESTNHSGSDIEINTSFDTDKDEFQSLVSSENVPAVDSKKTSDTNKSIKEESTNSLVQNSAQAQQQTIQPIPTLQALPSNSPKFANIQGPAKQVAKSFVPSFPEFEHGDTFWTSQSFFSNILPSPIPIRFAKAESTLPSTHYGLGLKSTLQQDMIIIDQSHKDFPGHLALRFSIARKYGTITWQKNLSSLEIPLTPVTLQEHPTQAVLNAADNIKTIKLRSLSDLPKEQIILKLTQIAPQYKTQNTWIFQHRQDVFGYEIELANTALLNKLLPYFAHEKYFDIIHAPSSPPKEGYVFINKSGSLATVYTDQPFEKKLQKLGIDLGAKHAFFGKAKDFFPLQKEATNRLTLIQKQLEHTKTLWLHHTSGVTSITKQAFRSDPAKSGKLISQADGFFFKKPDLIKITTKSP